MARRGSLEEAGAPLLLQVRDSDRERRDCPYAAAIESESPDILFTTTEMLNQRLGDGRFRHLFGVGDRATRPVEMMLLDEVHTYAGTTGAQVAFLIRRWRWLLRQPVTFVGLSATLQDGERFFARLTGLPEDACTEVTPAPSEMIAEGAEYLLALRGDRSHEQHFFLRRFRPPC